MSHADLYHGDCREVLPRLDDDSMDAIITDPPYGIAKSAAFVRNNTEVVATGSGETRNAQSASPSQGERSH